VSFTAAPNEFLTLLIAIIDHHTPYVPLQKHCLSSQSMSWRAATIVNVYCVMGFRPS